MTNVFTEPGVETNYFGATGNSKKTLPGKI